MKKLFNPPLTLSLSKGKANTSLWFDRRSTELTPRSHHERLRNDLGKSLVSHLPIKTPYVIINLL